MEDRELEVSLEKCYRLVTDSKVTTAFVSDQPEFWQEIGIPNFESYPEERDLLVITDKERSMIIGFTRSKKDALEKLADIEHEVCALCLSEVREGKVMTSFVCNKTKNIAFLENLQFLGIGNDLYQIMNGQRIVGFTSNPEDAEEATVLAWKELPDSDPDVQVRNWVLGMGRSGSSK